MNLVHAIIHVPDSPLTHLNLFNFHQGIEEIMFDLASTATPKLLYLNLGGIFMFENLNHFFTLLEVLKK